MSGGHFDYVEYRLYDIVQEIEEKHLEDNRYEFSQETLEKFREAALTIRKAAIMIRRVDYLLSDDDGEESFNRRWQKDLAEVEPK